MNPQTTHCFKMLPSQHSDLDSHPALRCRTCRTFWRWHQALGWKSWHDSHSWWSPISLYPPRITEVPYTWQGRCITLRPGRSGACKVPGRKCFRMTTSPPSSLFLDHNKSVWFSCCSSARFTSKQIDLSINPAQKCLHIILLTLN